VVWISDGGGEGWQVGVVLPPLPGDPEAFITGLGDDLAVGWSGDAESSAPAAWRLR